MRLLAQQSQFGDASLRHSWEAQFFTLMKGKEAWFPHQKEQQQQSRCPHQQGEKEGRQKSLTFPCTSSKLGSSQKWLSSLKEGLIPFLILPRNSFPDQPASCLLVDSMSNQFPIKIPSQCLSMCLLFYLYLCFTKGSAQIILSQKHAYTLLLLDLRAT